jgi:hypothetical protein
MAGQNPRGQNVGAVPQGITDAITNLQQAAGNAATTITNLRGRIEERLPGPTPFPEYPGP